VTLGYGLLTIGALFIYTALKNMSIRDIVLDRPGPGQPPDIVDLTKSFDKASKGVASGAAGVVAATGGSWGGAKAIADGLTKGTSVGVISTKRDTQSTASGGVSDHWTGCKECYAKDMSDGSSPTSGMDTLARKVVGRLGGNITGKSTVNHTSNYKGYRVQVLYRTNIGGNHFNHVHIGVRKIGYAP